MRPVAEAIKLEGVLLSEQSRIRRFEQIALPHLDAAFNLARWLTRNENDAEDVVQEAFLRAFKFFDGFQGGNGRSWLLMIVRNTCYTWLRHNRPAELVPLADQEAEEVYDPDSAAAAPEAFRAPQDDPETLLLKAADRRLLHELIEALPVPFREVVILRELEDLSYKDIAEIAGIPLGTVMSRLARARKLLQRSWTQHIKEESGYGL